MYQVKFPIGDWSDDGHGKCSWFIIKSNRDVNSLRELHFSCINTLGFDIGDICTEYGEDRISPEIIEILKETKIRSDIDEDYSPNEIFQLWLDILSYLDPTFNYVIERESIPSIIFAGYDEKKRHLNNPGYGLFE